jgi:hypothetical protein
VLLKPPRERHISENIEPLQRAQLFHRHNPKSVVSQVNLQCPLNAECPQKWPECHNTSFITLQNPPLQTCLLGSRQQLPNFHQIFAREAKPSLLQRQQYQNTQERPEMIKQILKELS